MIQEIKQLFCGQIQVLGVWEAFVELGILHIKNAIHSYAMQWNPIQCNGILYYAMESYAIHSNAMPSIPMQCNGILYNAMESYTMQWNPMHCNGILCQPFQCNAIHSYAMH